MTRPGLIADIQALFPPGGGFRVDGPCTHGEVDGVVTMYDRKGRAVAQMPADVFEKLRAHPKVIAAASGLQETGADSNASE